MTVVSAARLLARSHCHYRDLVSLALNRWDPIRSNIYFTADAGPPAAVIVRTRGASLSLGLPMLHVDVTLNMSCRAQWAWPHPTTAAKATINNARFRLAERHWRGRCWHRPHLTRIHCPWWCINHNFSPFHLLHGFLEHLLHCL